MNKEKLISTIKATLKEYYETEYPNNKDLKLTINGTISVFDNNDTLLVFGPFKSNYLTN